MHPENVIRLQWVFSASPKIGVEYFVKASLDLNLFNLLQKIVYNKHYKYNVPQEACAVIQAGF